MLNLPVMSFHRPLALSVLATVAIGLSASQPALAQDFGWEDGCAARVVSPGSGDALRVYNCSRQKDCQQIANARGTAIFEAGCFNVRPSPPQQPAGAVRNQPRQQQ